MRQATAKERHWAETKDLIKGTFRTVPESFPPRHCLALRNVLKLA